MSESMLTTISNTLTSTNGILAILFITTMVLRPIAMSTTAANMEDKDGAGKALPIFSTITALGVFSAILLMFGGKLSFFGGKHKLIAVIAALFAVILQFFGAMPALHAANASAAEYTSALFDGVAMIIVLVIVLIMNMTDIKANWPGKKAAEEAAKFGHFYY